MSIIAPRQSSQHFYDTAGVPHHFVQNKPGQANRLRPATVADARRHGWLPSVTSICKLFPSDGLRHWILEQHLLAAITTPRDNGESDSEFIERVLISAEEESRRAAAVGTQRHDICSQYVQKGIPMMEEFTALDLAHCQPYFQWLNDHVDHVVNSEFVVVNKQLGYAGTVDAHVVMADGSHAVLDIKNRRRLDTYETDSMQLAGYAHALPQEHIYRKFSIILGTAEPSILVREWGIEEGWEAFQLCHRLWCISKDYYPGETI